MDKNNWLKFKECINILKHYINNSDFISKNNKNKKFEILSKEINDLSKFITENDSFLTNYIDKVSKIHESYPFDMVCNGILDNFENFYKYIISDLFHNSNIKNTGYISKTIDNLFEYEYNTTVFDTNIKNAINYKIIVSFDILKKLSDHTKTLVILGANGSGKTSFANFLRNLDNHIKVIPASKPIKLRGCIPSLYNSTIDGSCNEILSKNDLEEDLLQKLIIGICSEHDEVSRVYYATGEKKESKFIKIKNIFEDFFDIELDCSEFSNKKIMAIKNGCENKFEFNNMSDGERVAFFYIATTIIAPQKSFIVVDEPENHLNPAIYNKIWDRLIKERSDCQFIFISHTMEFINARSDFELVKIKNFIYPDKFEFEFFGDSLKGINQNFLVEIIGSRKPILFCEGTRSSYDYEIYEILFGDKYTIIPTGNCISVINNVISCNQHANLYTIQKAIGIIDSDLKDDNEVIDLSNNSIYTLKCNEIEMLLIDENIFKKVLEHTFLKAEFFEKFKEEFFKKLSKRKDFIITRIIKVVVDGELHHLVIDDKKSKSIEEFEKNFKNTINLINIKELWNIFESKLLKIINNKEYDNAIRYCCLEHNEVINGICNSFVRDYPKFAIGVLKQYSSLVNIIKEKYFGHYGL